MQIRYPRHLLFVAAGLALTAGCAQFKALTGDDAPAVATSPHKALAGADVPVVADGNAKKRMAEVNSLAQKGQNKLPATWTSNAAGRTKSLEQASAYLDECQALVATVPDAARVNEGAWRRYQQLKDGVHNGALQVPLLATYEDIQSANKRGDTVGDEVIAQMKAQMDLLAAEATPEADRQVQGWAKRVSQMTGANVDLGERNQVRAEKEADAAESERRLALLVVLEKKLIAMQEIAEAGQAPIDEALFGDYEASLSQAREFQADVDVFYGAATWDYRLYNAWFQDAEAVATAFGGSLVSNGESKGKTLKIAFKGKAGHCYGIAGRWSNPSSKASKDTDLSAGKHYSYMQQFWAGERKAWWSYAEGACLSKDASMSLTGTLTYSGSKNAFQYVVVAWPRTDFPQQLALNMRTHINNRCDPEGWYQLWTNPVPGSLAWTDAGPVIFNSWDGTWGTTYTPDRVSEGRTHADKLSDDAPNQLSFSEGFGTSACWESTDDPYGKKWHTCLNKLAKVHGPKKDRARKARDNAKTPGAYRAADKRVSAADRAHNKAIASQCDPIMAKIRTRMGKAYDRVVDSYAQSKPDAHIGIVEATRAAAQSRSYEASKKASRQSGRRK